MIVIVKNIWNERKLRIIGQVINNLPSGEVWVGIKKLLVNGVRDEVQYGSFNSPF